jgi:hypothetical protein
MSVKTMVPPEESSNEASDEEKAELERMRRAILHRGDRRFWQLVPKRALFKGFWMILVILAIVWMQRNTGRIAQLFNQSLSPLTSPSSSPEAPHQPIPTRHPEAAK